MSRVRNRAVSCSLAVFVSMGAILAVLVARPVSAANSPTFRDCSLLVEGIDPDFVKLDNVTVDPSGALSVAPGRTSVPIEASESSDPGDSSGHVTLQVAVSAHGVRGKTVSGAETGKVSLSVPLTAPRPGRTYTLSWSATFDNGNHTCPSALTPDNTDGSHPFVVTVRSR